MPKLPSSSDVPQAQLARDPGVRAEPAAFQSPFGVAAEEVAPAVDVMQRISADKEKALAEAAEKQQKRRDIVDSATRIKNLTLEAGDKLDEMNRDNLLADDAAVEEYGKFVAEVRQRHLNEYTGSEDSKAQLHVRLLDIESQKIGEAAALSTAAGIAIAEDVYDDRISPLEESASFNPSIENLNKLLTVDVDTAMGDLSGSFGAKKELELKKNAQENIVLSAMNRLVIQGRVEEAESLLIDSRMNTYLSPENRRIKRRQIENVYKTRDEVTRAAEKAGAVERAKLAAKREHINLILKGTQPVEPGDNVVDTQAVRAPFSDGETATEDMQDAARLVTASRRLMLSGESQLANSLLSQARFIMENSSEIRRENELDKPISVELAREFGVPVGTPLKDVMGAIPRSPEQVAGQKAIETARGRQRIAGEEQVAFIDEANVIIEDLLEEIKVDPTVVGVGGSLRASGQTALGVIGDLGARDLVESARELAFENADIGLDDMGKMFDSPTLSALSIMENSIGMILARLRSPEGRIPVDVIKRSIDDVGLTGLKSSKQVENRLNFVLQQLNKRSGAISKRFKSPPIEGLGEPRYRVENGKLVQIQGNQ